MSQANISAIRINEKSPYSVVQSSSLSVQFVTRGGVLYDVGFTPDYSLGIEGVYQFYIQNVNHTANTQDALIRNTIWAIIEDFFLSNENAMLYICDTNDGRQQARNRLFKSWFTSYQANGQFEILSAEASFEGESYFASLIINKANPKFVQFKASFEEFQRTIQEKLS